MGFVLFLTNQCNLKCKYCFVSKNKETMSFETYKKAIQDYKERVRNITFFGGEPLLCFDRIKEIIAYNEKNKWDFTYNLNTNALLLKDEILDYCLEKKMLLNVSLDGNKKSNIKNRCNEEQFNEILNNIKTAIKRNGNVVVNYVIDPSNVEDYFEGIKFLVEQGIKEICLMINYEAIWKKKDIDIFREQNNKVIDYLVTEQKKTKIHPIDSKVNAIVARKDVVKCNFGNDNLIVSTKGEYYPCMHFLNQEEYRIKDKNEKMENTVDVKRCISCEYLPYCSNNCMCKNKKQRKESEVDVNCEFEKIMIRSATDYIIKQIDSVMD